MLQRQLSRVLSLGRRLSDIPASVLEKPAVGASGNADVPDWAVAPLQDLHGRRHDYLRVSLTERCNLRCQYCMPAEGAPLSSRGALLTRDELARAVRVLAALGVRKLRLTGGEPTLRSDLHLIIEELNAIPGITSVSMTTNGLVLTRRLPALARAGLSAINVSLDSLRRERYERMARRPGLPRVLAGVDLALQLGYRPVKINTVLMKGFNDDEILDFVEYTKDREVEVRFIEFMPFSGNQWKDERLVPYRTALKTILARHPELRACTPRPNDTARVWQVPGYAGRVGFIASMTQHFCATCNRLRITADGNLKVCLFGNAEVSLRDALRSGADDAELASLIRGALRNKKPQHAGECDSPHITSPAIYPFSPHHHDPRSGNYSIDISRHAESGANGEPADGSNRRVASLFPCAPFTARSLGLASKACWVPLRASARGLCSQAGDADTFTHLDASGHARMVDIGEKAVTARAAKATCQLVISIRLLRLLRDKALPKGDALGVARVAGVMAAKRTSDLIPLCHPLPLDCVLVSIELPKDGERCAVRVNCEVKVTARTGAEMEALAGCAGAALALYDMCKAVDKEMVVTGLRVVRKTGGKNDYPLQLDEPKLPKKLKNVDSKAFAPVNINYF